MFDRDLNALPSCMQWHSISMNPFQVTAPFQYPLATSEKRILAKNALNFYTAWKVFIFGVILVRIFPNSA